MQQNLNPQLDGGDEDFASLFEASLKERGGEGILKEGDIVKGTVVQVAKDYVVVDIGYKSEGQIPLAEFTDAERRGRASRRATRSTSSSRAARTTTACVVLSKEKADKMKVWDEISAACERDELIEGTISQRVKGGLSVTIRGGVKAFLPGSQVDLRPVRNLDSFIGKTYKFKVIKFNKKRGNIVLSRRVLLEKERDELKAKTLEKLKEGKVVKGIVKNLTEYGAFVDLGGIDGLLHITDMSWGRVNHPSELFQVGDEVTRQGPQVQRRDRARLASASSRSRKIRGHHAEEAYPPGTVRRAARSSRSPTTARSSSSSRASRASSTSARCRWTKQGQAPVEGARRRRGRSRRGARRRRQAQAHQRSA